MGGQKAKLLIKAHLSKAKAAVSRIDRWAIVAVGGGTFKSDGYNYEITEKDYSSGGNAMCW